MNKKQILEKAKNTFSSDKAAKQWMESPIPNLENSTPNQLIEAGNSEEVVNLLDKIKLGYFS